jgi:hypothetical protein
MRPGARTPRLAGRLWGIDNGAYPRPGTIGSGFDAAAFLHTLDRYRGHAGCLFVAAPDVITRGPDGAVIGDAAATLAQFPRWARVNPCVWLSRGPRGTRWDHAGRRPVVRARWDLYWRLHALQNVPRRNGDRGDRASPRPAYAYGPSGRPGPLAPRRGDRDPIDRQLWVFSIYGRNDRARGEMAACAITPVCGGPRVTNYVEGLCEGLLAPVRAQAYTPSRDRADAQARAACARGGTLILCLCGRPAARDFARDFAGISRGLEGAFAYFPLG